MRVAATILTTEALRRSTHGSEAAPQPGGSGAEPSDPDLPSHGAGPGAFAGPLSALTIPLGSLRRGGSACQKLAEHLAEWGHMELHNGCVPGAGWSAPQLCRPKDAAWPSIACTCACQHCCIALGAAAALEQDRSNLWKLVERGLGTQHVWARGQGARAPVQSGLCLDLAADRALGRAITVELHAVLSLHGRAWVVPSAK